MATVEEMMKAGLYRQKSSKTHPKMRPLICGTRNGSSMIDLEETLNLLNKALDFVKTKVKNNGILVIGYNAFGKNRLKNGQAVRVCRM